MLASTAAVTRLLADKRMRVLAVIATTRIRQLPDAPTLAEPGAPIID
ncbi:MAG: hypothetical protein JWN13_5658 [Betaproteobacteria bacterium]|jgi:tripartite-type tricarboxylate transporter receptor subunit TctC|nr:hypothetical protein [Betaproteobacteria bacterium]